MRVPIIVRPMPTRQHQADSLFDGATEQVLSRGTASLAVRLTGTYISRSFFGPDHAPVVNFSAADTWETFVFGDESTEQHHDALAFPWYHQLEQSEIVVEMRLVTADRMPLQVSAYTDELTGTLAQTTSNPSKPGYVTEPIDIEQWRRKNWGTGNAPKIGTFQTVIKAPTVPATRICVVAPRVQIVAGGNNPLLEVAGDWKVYMESILIFDRSNQRTYGNG